MQRITITIDDELVTALDRVIAEHGYQNRSEAIRDLARAGIAQLQEQSDAQQSAVAALVYVYDHQDRTMAQRLTGSFHEHHDLSIAILETEIARLALNDIQTRLRTKHLTQQLSTREISPAAPVRKRMAPASRGNAVRWRA